jgi:plasmid stabilization system protein ParE
VKLVIAPEAAADLQRLRAFLAEKNPHAAERAAALIVAAIDSLVSFPDRGRPAEGGGREFILPFGQSAYVLRYFHDEAAREIVVLRVWHGRERRD